MIDRRMRPYTDVALAAAGRVRQTQWLVWTLYVVVSGKKQGKNPCFLAFSGTRHYMLCLVSLFAGLNQPLDYLNWVVFIS